VVGVVVTLALAFLGVGCGDGEEQTPSPTASAVVTPTPAAGEAGGVLLRWYGHSMFLLTSPGGTAILTDPNSGIGYEKPQLERVDAVTVSHDHSDHNKTDLAGKDATVLRGVKDDDWVQIDQTIGDVQIRTIPTFHDAVQGKERGKNSMFLFETGGLRILFAGDLGHVLDEEQVAAVGQIDVLLLPVGGFFTIGPVDASQVVRQLNPKIVVPMHYKTDVVDFQDSDKMMGVDPFLGRQTGGRLFRSTLGIRKDTLPAETMVIVMDYQ